MRHADPIRSNIATGVALHNSICSAASRAINIISPRLYQIVIFILNGSAGTSMSILRLIVLYDEREGRRGEGNRRQTFRARATFHLERPFAECRASFMNLLSQLQNCKVSINISANFIRYYVTSDHLHGFQKIAAKFSWNEMKHSIRRESSMQFVKISSNARELFRQILQLASVRRDDKSIQVGQSFNPTDADQQSRPTA